jgi:hypothetical protein
MLPYMKKPDRQPQHCNWISIIALPDLAITQLFCGICVTAASQLLRLYKPALLGLNLIEGGNIICRI